MHQTAQQVRAQADLESVNLFAVRYHGAQNERDIYYLMPTAVFTIMAVLLLTIKNTLNHDLIQVGPNERY